MRRLAEAGFGHYADFALATFVIGAVALMIVPIPTVLLDVLLSVNIAGAVALLLVSLDVTTPLRISAFPAILLITTLFRLALNVSSTRLILSQADAGAVIDSFGHFVVQENYVVGAVVFAILTIIQFVVIAKGAERVSEVAARFVLDAMPGRQLAIDADLRSGAIETGQARERRVELQRESQLYGAMDGAMKFVKGDAIAAVVIIAINSVAGMAIGVVQLGMSPAVAAETFVMLTVGDGIASQIPALLIAMSAAIIVTRVASTGGRSHLGSEILSQLAAHPRALGLSGALLVLLGLVPGLPAAPFCAIGAVLLLVSWRLAVVQTHGPRPSEVSDELAPLAFEIGSAFYLELGARGVALLKARTRSVADEVLAELGIRIPEVSLHTVEGGDPAFAITLDDVPLLRGVLPDKVDRVEYLAGELSAVVRAHAGEFIDLRTTRLMLRSTGPDVADEVVPVIVGLHGLTEVLRRLVSEGISIRNLRKVLGLLAERGRSTRDPLELVEIVREGLARYICHKYATTGVLAPYVVDQTIEEMISGAVRTSDRGTYLALPPAVTREILDAVSTQIREDLDAGGSPVLLTQQSARPHLKRLVSSEMPGAVVLSFQELDPSVRVEPRGRVTVGRPQVS